MAKLIFTSHLNAVAPKETCEYPGTTVGEVLNSAFADHPRLAHYILDDQGHLRRHVVIFVDDERLAHAAALAFPLKAESEIYVLQALSGG